MQETHSDGSDTLKWQLEWGSQQFYLNHGQSNARGTAIAFKNITYFFYWWYILLTLFLGYNLVQRQIKYLWLWLMTYGVWFWAETNNLVFGFLFLYYLIPKTGWSNRMTHCKM